MESTVEHRRAELSRSLLQDEWTDVTPRSQRPQPVAMTMMLTTLIGSLLLLLLSVEEPKPSPLRYADMARQAPQVELATAACRRFIWVIRHGEKSANPQPGSDEVRGLNATGLRRAEYLSHSLELSWPRFALAFASNPDVPPGAALRELQTVAPLAAALGIAVNASFSRDETGGLAAAAVAAVRSAPCSAAGRLGGGSGRPSASAHVLIAWEHCRIPSLLAALGCEAAACAACWADGVYDRVVRLEVAAPARGGTPAAADVRVLREGFADDVVGIASDYECASSSRLAFSRCRLADGSWLGGDGRDLGGSLRLSLTRLVLVRP